MIGALISIVITLLVAGLLWWAITTILGILPIPEPIKTVINVILVVIVCLICIYSLVPLIGNIHLPLR